MKSKSIYTKKLGGLVAKRARPSNARKYHVISGDSNWRVVSDGSIKALRTFSTLQLAIDFAKNIASKQTGEVVIHEGNGNIKNRISYTTAK